MKRVLLALILLTTAPAAPGPVPLKWYRARLIWDQSPTPGVHYVLLTGSSPDRFNTRIYVGPSTSITVNGLREDYPSWFAVIAVDPETGAESDPSNAVRFVPPPPPTPQPPSPPAPHIVHPDR